MKTVFKNNFMEIRLDEAKGYAEVIYFETTADMSAEQHRADVLVLVDYFRQFQHLGVDKYLFDTRNQGFPLFLKCKSG